MNTFQWIGKLLSEYWLSFLRGMGSTLLMAIVGTAVGFLIGLLIAMVRTIPVGPGDTPFRRGLLRGVEAVVAAYV